MGHLLRKPLVPAYSVVVAHREPLMRLGLRAALETTPDLVVTQEVEEVAALCRVLRGSCPDLVVVDARFREEDPGFLDRLVQGCRGAGVVVLSPLSEAECPVCCVDHMGGSEGRSVALSDAALLRAESWCLSALQHGARGAVHRGVGVERLVEVMRSVARGGIVLDGWSPTRLMETPDGVMGGGAVRVTVRELEVMREVARGYANKQIGGKLGISEQTVKNHLARVMAKLGVHTRTELARLALERHLA